MPQQELLSKVVHALDKVGIPYMVSGSVASSLQGEPRSTHDIDFVVALDPAGIKPLVRAFPPPDFHLDEESILTAVSTRGMFNLIDVTQGDKVDFWVLTDEPFDRSRFGRRYPEEVMGVRIMVSSPEDTILAKLWWARLSGGSEKQFTDALRVYEVQFERLDKEYLHSWARDLNVEALLKRLEEEAQVL